MAKQEKRKVIAYIAASLDGYIAKPGDDLSFLDPMQTEGEDYGYAAFMASVDTVLVGRKTYDWVCKQVGSYPHSSKICYVLTRTPKPADGQISFYSGSFKKLIETLRKEPGLNIFCEGGAAIVQRLLRDNLIDEIQLFIVPVLLGQGIRLFDGTHEEQKLELVEAKSYASGMVQLHYRVEHAAS